MSTKACGTVRTHRTNMALNLHVIELRRGEMVFRGTDSDILALVWRDKKNACMLSIMHFASMYEGH